MKKLRTVFACAAVAAAALCMTCTKAQAKDGAGNIVIIVDPGHGGNDGGATSSYDNEATLNWNIAAALKAELQTYNGVKVYLTRGSAEWNSNAARGRMGQQLGADLFVSVHNNSGSNSSANGVQVYGTVNSAYKDSIKNLCTSVASHVSALGLANGGYQTRTSTKDPSRDYYTMLDEAVKCNIPGIIIEHCYLSNPSDAQFIHNEDNQRKCGAADATAIAAYYGLTKRGVSAGSSITLERTYSANMTGCSAGSYSSSNTSVAYVSSDGVITAVGAGEAVITGSAGSVTVKVPQPELKAIAAGINPTFCNASDVASYNQSTVMVKAVYSDGSAVQLSSGYTFGGINDSGNGAYDIPVSYQGLSCNLRIYGTGAAGSYSLNNYKVTGTNKDILVYPAVYNGVNTGITIKNDNGQTSQTNTTPVQTEAPAPTPTEPEIPETTQAPTEEETTVEETTAEETTVAEETEPETETVQAQTEAKTEPETESETGTDDTIKTKTVSKGLLIAAVAILLAGVIVAIVYVIKRKKGNINE